MGMNPTGIKARSKKPGSKKPGSRNATHQLTRRRTRRFKKRSPHASPASKGNGDTGDRVARSQLERNPARRGFGGKTSTDLTPSLGFGESIA
jgi:hypothetical protein